MTEQPRIFWLHHLCLRLPSLAADTQAVFVWDDVLLQQQNYSLKRLVFIYETLCAMPVTILQGRTANVLASLSPAQVITWQAPDAHLRHVIDDLQHRGVPVQCLDETPFVVLKKDLPLKRFFQYWSKTQKSALQIDGGADAAHAQKK